MSVVSAVVFGPVVKTFYYLNIGHPRLLCLIQTLVVSRWNANQHSSFFLFHCFSSGLSLRRFSHTFNTNFKNAWTWSFSGCSSPSLCVAILVRLPHWHKPPGFMFSFPSQNFASVSDVCGNCFWLWQNIALPTNRNINITGWQQCTHAFFPDWFHVI